MKKAIHILLTIAVCLLLVSCGAHLENSLCENKRLLPFPLENGKYAFVRQGEEDIMVTIKKQSNDDSVLMISEKLKEYEVEKIVARKCNIANENIVEFEVQQAAYNAPSTLNSRYYLGDIVKTEKKDVFILMIYAWDEEDLSDNGIDSSGVSLGHSTTIYNTKAQTKMLMNLKLGNEGGRFKRRNK